MVMESWRRFVTAKSFLFGFGMAVENRRHFFAAHNQYNRWSNTAVIIARFSHCEFDALDFPRALDLVLRCRLRALFLADRLDWEIRSAEAHRLPAFAGGNGKKTRIFGGNWQGWWIDGGRERCRWRGFYRERGMP